MKLSIAILCLLLGIWINNGYCQNPPTRAPNAQNGGPPTRAPNAQNGGPPTRAPNAQNGGPPTRAPTGQNNNQRPANQPPTRPAGQNNNNQRPANQPPTRPGAQNGGQNPPTRPSGQNQNPPVRTTTPSSQTPNPNGPITRTTTATANRPPGTPSTTTIAGNRPGGQTTTIAGNRPGGQTTPSGQTGNVPGGNIPGGQPTTTRVPITVSTTTRRQVPTIVPTVPQEGPGQLPTAPSTSGTIDQPIRDMRCPSITGQQILLSHPFDCSRFIQCTGSGMGIERLCPDNQHWNELRGWCDFPDRAGCQVRPVHPTILPPPVTTRPQGVPDNRCPAIDTTTPVHLPHSRDCARFFKCMGGLAFEYNCPPGQHFNVQRDYCDWPRQANCQVF